MNNETAHFCGGNVAAGASNFMGAYIVDWPIEYDDLEPYYTKVEQLIGVSGRVMPHPNLEHVIDRTT